MMTDQLRTFVACELPREIRSEIGRIQESLKHRRLRLKWVRPENLHITLKFLGDVPVESIESIADAIGKAVHNFSPMSLSARGIGVFPGIRRPRVLWIGIGGEFPQLARLQGAVATGLAAVGYPVDKRPYKGHLTIGRIKTAIDSRRLTQSLAEFADFETAPFRVGEVVVFRSQLKPDGPIYTRLRTVALDAH